MKIKFTLNLAKFGIAQFTIVTIVIVLGFLSYVFTHLTGHNHLLGFLHLLNVGNEQSVPTYVAVVNLLLASILCFIIYTFEKSNKVNGSTYWLFLSVLMLFLSIDESAGIHELFGNVHDYLVNLELISPILSTHKWLPFGLFFVFVVSIILVPFIWKLPTKSRLYFLTAGIVFITGAIGFEYLGAVMLETGLVESRKDIAYLVRRIFEEGFELYGVAILNYALYREILRRNVTVVISG